VESRRARVIANLTQVGEWNLKASAIGGTHIKEAFREYPSKKLKKKKISKCNFYHPNVLLLLLLLLCENAAVCSVSYVTQD
jgi:hypothetical protein